MFKIVKGIVDIDWGRNIKFNDLKTRGHDYRFSREYFGAKRSNKYSRFVTICNYKAQFLLEQSCSSMEQYTFRSRNRAIIVLI